MDFKELEAALKARIDEERDNVKFEFDNDNMEIRDWHANRKAGLEEALTLISQLKQSVEAKRDEIVKMQERGSGYDPITLGVVLKKFDEIIGEGT